MRVNAGFDREPMKLLQGRSDVFNKGSSGYDTSGCVLYQLEFVKRFPRKTKEERFTVVQTGCDQGVYQDRSAGC